MFLLRLLRSTRLSFVLVSFVCLNIAVAGGHRGGPGGPAGAEASGQMRHMEKAAAKLDLTEAQKQDFVALMELYRPRFESIAKRGKADRQKLLEMAPDDVNYSAQVQLVSIEASQAAAESVTLMGELQGLMYALLMPEQQQTYLEMRAEQRAKMDEYREQRKSGDYQGWKGHGKGHGHQCAHKNHAPGDCPHKDAGTCPHKDGESCPAKDSTNASPVDGA